MSSETKYVIVRRDGIRLREDAPGSNHGIDWSLLLSLRHSAFQTCPWHGGFPETCQMIQVRLDYHVRLSCHFMEAQSEILIAESTQNHRTIINLFSKALENAICDKLAS